MSGLSVDVIVATRDRPELLGRALRGIMNQDYDGPITCTVVFDRSDPDRSIMTREAERRILVTTNARADGLAGARNTGLEKADGDMVAFCDDDDEWLPTKITAQMRAMAESGGGKAREDVIAYGSQLKSAGLATALVTNNAAEFREHWRKSVPLSDLFHHVIDSSEVGVRKPDPKIFELALDRLGAPAERTVFLDDFQGNLDAAAQLGIHGILVEDDYVAALDALRERLKGREDTSPEEIERRMVTAAKELQEVWRYDLRVVNDDLQTAVAEIRTFLAGAS